MRRVFVSLLLILLLLSSLFSCKKKPESSDVFYEITFSTSALSYAAEPPASLFVKQGDRVKEPRFTVEPTAGYVVIWTKDTADRTPYDFSTPVEESFTLYAVEVPRTYSIIYLLQGGINLKKNPHSYTKASETISLLSLPNENCPWGYRFRKWSYFDDEDSEVVEIPHGSEGDIVLRAVYTPATYRIYYSNLQGAANPNPDAYTYGTELTLQLPTREGYICTGFTVSKYKLAVSELTSTFVYDNQNVLFRENGAINLYANWEEVK